MRISQHLLREVDASWGDINPQEDKAEEYLLSLRSLGIKDLEKVFVLAENAKNNCDYETANAAFAILLEIFLQTNADITVEYEHDDRDDDNYMHLLWLVLGSSCRLNIPVPILREEALERALRLEKRRFLRTEHNRIRSAFDYEVSIGHRETLAKIFGEETILQACDNNLLYDYQPDWL